MVGLQWHHFHTVVFLLGCRAEGVLSARLPVGLLLQCEGAGSKIIKAKKIKIKIKMGV